MNNLGLNLNDEECDRMIKSATNNFFKDSINF